MKTGSSESQIVIPRSWNGYSVVSIGNSAFRGCSSLSSISIPSSVTSIGDWAFEDCSSLSSVSITEGVTSIGECAFFECSSLASISIPSSVTSIDGCAFLGCSSLTDVYYSGSQEQWNAIAIRSNNDNLLSATIHYNS